MSKQIQMFLLPYAGGSSRSFHKLIQLLDDRIEAIPVEYAGRMTRRSEGFIEDYNLFLKDTAEQINKNRNPDIPFILMGYSLGSILTYDLTIQGLICGELAHLFLCAKGSLLNKTSVDKEFTDEEVINEMRFLGGTDERLFADERFLSIYMEPVKKDFNVWRQFVYTPGHIFCNATVIYSREDPAAFGVHDWSKIIQGEIEYFDIGHNHFFINENWGTVADIMNDKICHILKDRM